MIASRFSGLNLASCGRLGCMMRRRTSATVATSPAGEPPGAEDGEHASGRKRQGRGRDSGRRAVEPVPSVAGRGGRSGLRAGSGRTGRPATRSASARRSAPSAMPRVFQGKPVNRWPRSHSLSRQPEGEREHAAGARRPEQARQGEAEGGEQGQSRRQAENAERQSPGELVGLDQEGRAEPPEPGHEIAEAPRPAGERGGPQRCGGPESAARRGPVDQPRPRWSATGPRPAKSRTAAWRARRRRRRARRRSRRRHPQARMTR